jgi:tetratricopeptide (TPR) repeat protein
MHLRLIAGLCAVLPLLPACVSAPAATAPPTSATYLRVTAADDAAEALFAEGLVWCYAFHHAEASRCFNELLALDPSCAMGHWGLAYAAGPHINNMEMSEESARAAHEHTLLARALAPSAKPVEQALIEALAARYSWPAPADRKALDQAYADAMRAVYREHGSNPDVAALYAESLMDLRPWDLWTAQGEPQPGTLEIVEVLEKLLSEYPDHPQGCHLYIHTVEASREPGRATAAAERLRTRIPYAGHLVHMPAHIDIRTGRYADAIEANQRGVAADQAIIARTGREGFYEVYRAHNYHFLAYAAMFAGREDVALKAARELTTELPAELVKAMPQFLDAFMPTPLHVLVRFGRWDTILAEPAPPEHLPYTRALWHYARGIALANLDRGADAEREREAFNTAAAAVPETFFAGNNACRTILEVGRAVLDGEVHFRAGRTDEAFVALREGARLEDELRYDEPWGWMMPARHPLGALLFEAGRTKEAEAVYRADLERHPNNGWALRGLAKCLTERGATKEAAEVERAFEVAWRGADVAITASCLCARR